MTQLSRCVPRRRYFDTQLLPADVLAYDVDHSGVLTLQEWLEGWEKNPLSEPEMVKSVAKAIEVVISDPDQVYAGRADGTRSV